MQDIVRRNIYSLYIIKFSKWFMLVIPIMAMFYKENNVDEFQLFILQGAYALSTSILEIPSGYLADIWGRKKAVVLGSVLGAIGYVIYSFSYSFSGFLLAEVILGIGISFISGTDSALLFDTLSTIKKEQEYTKYEGRITSLGGFFETAASILGGLTATWFSLRMPFYLQSIIAFAAIPAAFFLKEPEIKNRLSKISFMQIIDIAKYSLFINKNSQSTILFSAVIGSATLTMAWSLQVFGVFNNFSKIQFTGLWVLLNLIVALSALFSYKLERFIGKRNTIILITTIIPLGYIVTGFINLYAIPFLLLFYVVRGIATPILKDYINQFTDSNIRATVLSIRNLIIRLLFLFIGVFIGWYSKYFGFLPAMLISGFVFVVFSLFAVFVFLGVHKDLQ